MSNMHTEKGREKRMASRHLARLSQTGPDDMPKTVVYAAQDISANRHER